jgi:RND family efflux transporter MFP subunit
MGIFSKLIRYGTIVVALAGVAAILGIARLQAERQLPPAGDPPLPPAPKPYAQSVSATGILEALSENVAIGVPQSGLVAEMKVKVNEAVKTGDVLFRLDDRDLRAQEVSAKARLEVARANVAVSEAQLGKAKSQLARLSAVSDPRAVSVDDLENRKQDVAVAAAQLDSVHAGVSAVEGELKSLSLLIERLTVRAPRDGTVIQVNIRGGEYASTAPKEPAMIIGETGRLQVRADVDEQNATRIRPGQNGRASLKGDPSVSFPLDFVRVEPYVIPKVSLTGAGTERVDTRVLHVIFSLTRPKNPPVYVGQQVDVFIEAPEN